MQTDSSWIKSIISQYQLVLDSAISSIDYTIGLRNSVLLRELKIEIGAIKKQLAQPNEFKNYLKLRLKERYNNRLQYLSPGIIGESITNRFYWTLVEEVLKPTDIMEAVSYFFPEGKFITFLPKDIDNLPIDLDSVSDKKRYLRDLRKKKELDQKILKPPEGPASLNRLLQIVSINGYCFDISWLEKLSLADSAKLLDALKNTDKELYRLVVNYNADTQVLESDVKLFQEEYLTPRCALQRLVHSLMLSGSRSTGEFNASPLSITAIDVFQTYLELLPADIKEAITKISSVTLSLEHIFRKEIEKGECVETTSTHILEILNAHPFPHPILDVHPDLSKSPFFAKILEKYLNQNRALDTHRNNDLVPMNYYPSALLSALFTENQIVLNHNIIYTLFSFSEDVYPHLLNAVHIRNNQGIFLQIVNAIDNDFFNQTQINALTELIPTVFTGTFEHLLWSLIICDLNLFHSTMKAIDTENRFSSIKSLSKYIKKHLILSTKNVKFLKIIKENLAINDYISFIVHTYNILDKDRAPVFLNVLLTSLESDEARLKALERSTLIQDVKYIPESLKAILSSLTSDEARLNVIQRSSLLSDVRYYLDSVKAILSSLESDETRLNVIERSNLLWDVRYIPESIKAILSSLTSDEARLTALKRSTLIQDLKYIPESIKAILSSLTSDEARLNVIERSNLLWDVRYYIDSVKAILSSLESDETRLKVIELGHLLQIVSNYPESIKAILSSLKSDEARLKALDLRNIINENFFHLVIDKYLSLTAIFTSLESDAMRLQALNIKDGSNLTILDLVYHKSESLKAILNTFQPEIRSKLNNKINRNYNYCFLLNTITSIASITAIITLVSGLILTALSLTLLSIIPLGLVGLSLCGVGTMCTITSFGFFSLSRELKISNADCSLNKVSPVA